MTNLMFWILIAYLALGAIASVAMVGRRREPITPGAAVLSVLASALFITALCIWGR